MKLKKYIKSLLLVVFLFITSYITVTKHLDNDFWFTINHGRYILENGFTNIEPFTLHEGLSFSFQKWLTSIVFYLVYTKFGYLGIHLLITCLMSLTSFIMWKCASLISGNKRNSAVIVSIIMAVFSFQFAKTRPQIFSYLFLVLEIYQLEKYVKDNKAQHLFVLPLYSLLLMQFHSTMWLMFIIFMLPYIFELNWFKAYFKVSEYKKIPLLIVLALSVLIAGINPYGFNSVIYLFNSNVKEISTMIKELQMTTIGEWPLFICTLLPMLIWLFFKKNKEDMPLRYIFFLFGTGLMALVAVRNMAYFILVSTLIVAWMYKDISIKINKKIIVGMFIGLLIGTPLIIYNTVTTDDVRAKNQEAKYVVANGKKPLDFLASITTPKNTIIYTSFNEGSYAEWLGFKAYIDPRAEVFVKEINKKEDIFKEWMLFYKGYTNYKQLEDKYSFDYWLINKYDTYYRDFKASSLKVIYEDDEYVVYEGEKWKN